MTIVNNPTSCQEECQKNVGCNFWTLTPAKKCFLKPKNPKAPTPLIENKPNSISGPKTCTKDKLNNVNNCGTGILNYSKLSQRSLNMIMKNNQFLPRCYTESGSIHIAPNLDFQDLFREFHF